MDKNRNTTPAHLMFAIFILATLMTPGCSLAGQPTTAVPTSMVSPTPEASATPAPTAIPTLSAEEKIAAAMEVACGERPAISPEVGSSSAETVGARICPDPYYKATIPDEMIAQTPGELQYAIHIYRGQDASGGTCGPYTRTGETEPGGGVYVLTNRPVVVVDIINVKSGEVVDHNSIEGIPASCPQQIPEDTRILSGEEVSGQTIQDALVAALSGFVSSGSGGTVQQVPAPSSLAGSFATFSPDGKVLAVVADTNQVVQLWDTTRWKQMRALRDFEQTIWDVSISHDGKQVAVDTGTTTIWDVASGKQVNALEAHFPIAFSPDGKTLASGSFEGPIQLWDISSGSILHTLEGTISNYGSGSIAFSPDGKLLAVSGGDRQTALVWDVADGKLLATLKGHTRNVSMVIFSQDGKKLATGGLDGAVIVWDTAKWGKLRALAAHTDFVEGIAFSPDGTWIVTAGRDKKIIFWDIASGKKLQILKDFGEGKNIEHIVLSPNGKLLGIVFRDSIDLVQVELP